ncbi:hypothetical protein [Reyranella sp.]|uniref:hypothetical protein n=1 Tax=Reyranella sp. TaxID=1929291 RepID=UPI0037838FA5
MSLSTADLAEILKKRQIKAVYYFHTDHFEPWSLGINERTARGVERMREMSAASPFARKMSLFYCPFVPYNIDLSETKRAAGYRVDGDAVVFGPRTADQERLARDVIRPLVTEDRHEMHLHVHHEFWTRNDSNFDAAVSRWVNANSTAELDEKRLDLGFRVFKEVVSKETGEPFDRWAFIHGNWALAGSDPMICKIESEFRIIMRHGGFGDFSFPAGRGHCDPRLMAPFTCLPIDVKRAYDDPAAEPRPIGHGALEPGRFFIWNSPIKANYSSLDYYSASNCELFKDPSRMVSEWLSGSVSLGGDLFIKTHAHSMKWEYEIFQPHSLIPHCHPDVAAIFEELSRVCDRAGVEFRPVTVNEIMQSMLSHDVADAPNDSVVAASEDSFRVGPSAQVHSTLEAKDQLPKGTNGNAMTAFDRIAPLERELASTLSKWVHNDPHGTESAGSFYLDLIDRDHILQDYERAVFDYITLNFALDRTRIVEVGVGYGILSTLLAAAGYEVVAFEGNPLRMAGFEFLANSIADRVPGLRDRLRPISGWFPDALGRAALGSDRRNVLLTTNVVSSATDERKELILSIAGRFDDLLIDTTRFGVQRYGSDEQKFRTSIANLWKPVSSVLRKPPNEIWHFQPTDAARKNANGVASAPSGRGSFLNDTAVKDFDSFSTELLALQHQWMSGEGAAYLPDDLYASKVKRSVTLESYELAIAEAIAQRFERDTTIIEIGSGYGAFVLLLAQAGFVVHGFDGDRRRSVACTWHLRQYLERYPHLASKVSFTARFFPDALPSGFGQKVGKRIGVATNVTNTYTAIHQEALLYAARDFDEFILDLSRFGKVRDAQPERDSLRDVMAKSHFEPIERLYFAQPYEYWRFRIRPASRISIVATAPSATQLIARATAPLSPSSPSPVVVLER